MHGAASFRKAAPVQSSTAPKLRQSQTWKPIDIKDFLTVALMIEVGETFVGGEDFLWNPERVDQVDWEELAAKKGEKIDIAAWEDLKRWLQQDFEALEA